MKTIALFFTIFLLNCSLATAALNKPTNPSVTIKTNFGPIIIELNQSKAPETVANFLAYVDSGFYNNTIFHRVIKDFLIQGGGLTLEMEEKQTRAPIANGADNGLVNIRGTIAMAQGHFPHTATSQFFINTKNNSTLNHTGKGLGWGFCVFGKVTTGMDVVDTIDAAGTTIRNGRRNVPSTPIIIQSITRNSRNTEHAAQVTMLE